MSVVTVSRQMGSLGTEIAKSLAQRLGYEYIDKEVIGKALMESGMPAPHLDRFDEKKPPFWDSWQIERRRFVHILQAILYDLARRGRVVIVGRGGQVLLRDLASVFHLRIVAPMDLRVRRIMEDEGVAEKEAVRILRRNDRDSAGFIRSFFDADWSDPDLYDLVINTQKLSVARGVEMILGLLHAPDALAGRSADEKKLADLAMFQKVEAALLNILGIDIRHVNMEVQDGEVTIRGSVGSQEDKDRCQRAIDGIPGIHRVDNQLLVAQYFRFGG